MGRKDDVVDIPDGTGLRFLRVAQDAVMVQVAEPYRRIRGMIDNVGDKEDGAEDNGDPVDGPVGVDPAVPYQIQAQEQQNGRDGIQDRME